MPAVKMTAQDRLWRSQDDARVLAQAEEIKKDKRRLTSAKVEAKKMVKDQEVQLASLKRISQQPILKKK